MKTFDFTGKSAFVTGAGRGIGRGIALALADCCANVWIADLLEDNAKQVADEVRALGVKAGWSKVDVSSKEEMTAAFDAAIAEFGKLDFVVNTAGIFNDDSMFEGKPDVIRRVIDINTLGATFGTQLALNHMKETGGHIVNIASQAGRKGEVFSPFYCMSKAAVINMTQSAALTGAPYNILVNTVCPGSVRTPMMEDILLDLKDLYGCEKEQAWQNSVSGIPLKRAQTEQDIADAVLFFCDAPNITGQALNVDGGMKMN